MRKILGIKGVRESIRVRAGEDDLVLQSTCPDVVLYSERSIDLLSEWTQFDCLLNCDNAQYSGKRAPYWQWVLDEGMQVFKERYKHVFRRGDTKDCEDMGQLWEELSPDRKSHFKARADQQNAPELVARRRAANVEHYQRAVEKDPGLALKERSIRNAIQHRNDMILARRAAEESDIPVYTQDPLVVNDHYMQTLIDAKADVIKVGFRVTKVNLKEQSVEQIVQNMNMAVLKMNIYDDFYTSSILRSHPSEVALVIFSPEKGVITTKTWLVSFSPNLLYKSDTVPGEHWKHLNNETAKTGIIPTSGQYRLEIPRVFYELGEIVKEYTPYILVNENDWNLVRTSMFFMAHGSQAPITFGEIEKRLVFCEDFLGLLSEFWMSEGAPETYKPWTNQQISDLLRENMLARDSPDYPGCDFHRDCELRHRANCALGKALVVVHHIFTIWDETKFANCPEKPPHLHDLAMDLPPGVTVYGTGSDHLVPDSELNLNESYEEGDYIPDAETVAKVRDALSRSRLTDEDKNIGPVRTAPSGYDVEDDDDLDSEEGFSAAGPSSGLRHNGPAQRIFATGTSQAQAQPRRFGNNPGYSGSQNATPNAYNGCARPEDQHRRGQEFQGGPRDFQGDRRFPERPDYREDLYYGQQPERERYQEPGGYRSAGNDYYEEPGGPVRYGAPTQGDHRGRRNYEDPRDYGNPGNGYGPPDRYRDDVYARQQQQQPVRYPANDRNRPLHPVDDHLARRPEQFYPPPAPQPYRQPPLAVDHNAQHYEAGNPGRYTPNHTASTTQDTSYHTALTSQPIASSSSSTRTLKSNRPRFSIPSAPISRAPAANNQPPAAQWDVETQEPRTRAPLRKIELEFQAISENEYNQQLAIRDRLYRDKYPRAAGVEMPGHLQRFAAAH
ncbi:unnamed protein product, partial [Mesorhabditis spiculigera]